MTGTACIPCARTRQPGGWASHRCGSGPGRSAADSRSPPRRAPALLYGWRCPPMSEPIRVLIVDDHQVVRQGLRTFLDVLEDIEVVGEAGDGIACVEAAEELRPDVIL